MISPTPKNILTTGALLLSATLTTPTHAATLQRITEPFGPNPTNVTFYIYVPDTLKTLSEQPNRPSPPILVNPHWCHGTASAVFESRSYPRQADLHNFIIIYPETPQNREDQCWDVSSHETLAHNAGGDSLGIISMINYTIHTYNADPKRVFVTGTSSGAMMTNVLIATYPDIFAAGSSWAGVPAGCFAAATPGNNSGLYGYWNDQCARGQIQHSGQEWKAIVESAYPGYNGWRPKFQTFHGTKDEILDYVNFEEQIKQWTAVLGLSDVPSKTEENTPLNGWTKNTYGPNGWFEAYSVKDVTHDIRVQANTVIDFFQLDCKSNCFSWGQGSPL